MCAWDGTHPGVNVSCPVLIHGVPFHRGSLGQVTPCGGYASRYRVSAHELLVCLAHVSQLPIIIPELGNLSARGFSVDSAACLAVYAVVHLLALYSKSYSWLHDTVLPEDCSVAYFLWALWGDEQLVSGCGPIKLMSSTACSAERVYGAHITRSLTA